MKPRLRSRSSAFLALLAASVSVDLTRARTARADDVDELDQLLGETVVQGASKSAEVASDAPATTKVITAEEMHRYGIRSLDEAINFLGMSLFTSNPLHAVEIGGRGVLLTSDFGNHVLLVVDGHVFNEPWDGTAYFEQGAAIPIDLIDHIELIVGPGSVLYGGSAMLGVISVVTKHASSLKGAVFTAEGSASPQQGTSGQLTSFAPGDLGGAYRLAASFGRELTLFDKPAEIVAGIELYRQNGPSFAWAPQTATNGNGDPANFGPNTAPGTWGGRTTHQYSASVPSIYTRFLWGNFTVMARAASYTRRTPYQNAFNQYFTDFDDPLSFERDRWLSLDIQHHGRIGKLATLVRGYGDLYDFHQEMHTSDGSNCDPVVAGTCTNKVEGRSRWAGLEAQGNVDWMGDDRLTTLFGADGRVRNVGGQSDSYDGQNQYVGGVGRKYLTELVGSAYAQQRFTPVKPLHLNAGARFDADPRGGNRVSPRAAAAIETWKGGVTKFIYSEAFRAPTFYESYYESAGQKQATNLRSETVRSVEASVEQAVGKHRFLFGVFRTWWSDLIGVVSIDDSTVQTQNIAKIDNWGFNARADGAFGDLRYGMSITEAHTDRSRPDGTDTQLPVAPQVFGNARLAYDLPGALPTVAVATTFVAKRPADRALDGNFATAPYAPASLDLRLTLSERVPGVPGLSYRIAADYVTAARSPYVAGPTQSADPTTSPGTNAALAPINRMTGFVTLRYELPL